MTDQTDLAHKAIVANELPKLLIGDPPYFFDSKTDEIRPQNFQQVLDRILLPYWSSTHDPDLPSQFLSSLMTLLQNYTDRNKALFAVSSWIWCYRSCVSRKEEQPAGFYAALFEVDLSPAAELLRRKLEECKQDLLTDTRWAGASWNSQAGLWEPIVRTAQVVRDKLNGPDYITYGA